MSILSRLFGGKGAADAAAPQGEDYKGFRVYVAPMKEGREYRLAARIELGEGDAQQTHQMIRADTFQSESAAAEASLAKAKQMIDEQGERLFGWP